MERFEGDHQFLEELTSRNKAEREKTDFQYQSLKALKVVRVSLHNCLVHRKAADSVSHFICGGLCIRARTFDSKI